MEGYVTKRQLEKVEQRRDSALTKLKHLKAEGMKVTKVGLRSVGVGAAAGLVGFAEGKATDLKDTEVLGLPLGLAVAAAGTLINVAGYGGDEQTSELIQAGADGGLAAYAFSKGKEMGIESKTAK